jgi:hypothetical protein
MTEACHLAEVSCGVGDCHSTSGSSKTTGLGSEWVTRLGMIIDRVFLRRVGVCIYYHVQGRMNAEQGTTTSEQSQNRQSMGGLDE